MPSLKESENALAQGICENTGLRGPELAHVCVCVSLVCVVGARIQFKCFNVICWQHLTDSDVKA